MLKKLPDRFFKNKTLYGLRTNSTIRIKFDSGSNTVIEIIGIPDVLPEDSELSESTAFNIPQWISIAGVPYFPSKYEFSKGIVWYHARHPPAYQIKLVTPTGISQKGQK